MQAGLEQAAVGGGHLAVGGAVDEHGVEQPGAAELLQQGVEAGGEGGGVEAGAPGRRVEPLGIEGAALRVGDAAELEVHPPPRAGLVLADLPQQLGADVAHPPDHELQLGPALEELGVDVAHGPAGVRRRHHGRDVALGGPLGEGDDVDADVRQGAGEGADDPQPVAHAVAHQRDDGAAGPDLDADRGGRRRARRRRPRAAPAMARGPSASATAKEIAHSLEPG